MNESTITLPPPSFNTTAARWASEPPAPRAVRPASRTELRGALEANEVFFSLMEILPDYARCGINE